MEGIVVSSSMRNEQQVLRVDIRAQGREEFVIESLQVCVRRLDQRIPKRTGVLSAKPELRELKLQQSERVSDSRCERHRHNRQPFAAKQACQDAISALKIFDNERLRSDRCPDFF